MAEAMSPKPPAAPRSTASTASRTQSPTSPLFVLCSNDDQLERAQARVARAAAIRCKAATVSAHSSLPDDRCLSREQIIKLFQECIKLASENKITQKNTWELKLIDHLSDIIKVGTENGVETNFHKASCTLEAGLKIYSARVDSLHAEAYKVLSGMNRARLEDEQVTTMEDGHVSNKQGREKESERKIDPMSTVESSFEALNIKKFDVTLVADPLYHQTFEKLDEGGAKGLLLNNLGAYGGCQVLSDAYEVPGKCRSCSLQKSLEQMVVGIRAKTEICPTLKEIFCQFDENNHRSSQDFNISQNADLKTDPFNAADYYKLSIDQNDHMGGDQENMSFGPSFRSHHEDNNSHTSYEADVDDRFEKVSMFLFQGLGLKENSWSGPDHWKYWRPKGSEEAPATRSRPATNISKNKNYKEVELDFTASLDNEIPNIFAVPKNFKSLLLPPNRIPVSNRLPDDCRYKPENLVKLFLLPNVMCLGKRRQQHTDYNSWKQSHNFDEALRSWDDESLLSGQYNDGCIHSDVEDSDTLVSPPRQVSNLEVQYDRTSKQVDVHALKETLWGHMQESARVPTAEFKDTISFKYVLATFPVNCRAAAAQDITPHLCFICLLHLANDRGLSIDDCPTLDDMNIHLPSRQSQMEWTSPHRRQRCSVHFDM
ncbi:condensin complex subunit 2-like [Pyrus ussuriensis x Pyrus communis]|uniref:Condensin complex subunit 2-like n=1 Tax=Pyrus ussuriensis x Pyrus communis TaxID=2448454 RepID=A0A5N5FSK9_9ROSA|nr:condensin complex subunit 2-like [Pyrus ussuriensis x Pyrus communis]